MRRHRSPSGHPNTGVASNKALDIPFATTTPNTQFQLWTPTGQPNQQWQIAPTDNGTFTIESRSNAYNVAIDANSTTDGADIVQWPTTGATNQQWELVKIN